MIAPENQRGKWAIFILLAMATLGTFWPALHCGFINYDDNDYVRLNPAIQHGLNGPSIRWAFTSSYASNWHPLTWVSHMIDYDLYGLNPTGHHLTNVVLHVANSVLLFLLLRRMTGALGASAFVAAMFALHPLRVESVVWIAERKDVLSSFFWMLTVICYARYVETLKSQLPHSKLYYAVALLCFACGLMAKPMLVSLPFVLLLMDYWPLGRWPGRTTSGTRLMVEKIPFLLLAAGDSIVTYKIQLITGAVMNLDRFPWNVRLSNAAYAYASYLAKTCWPVNLAIYYPHRHWGLLQTGVAVGLLGTVSVLVIRLWRARPYLAVGWFWFLGTLVPTIGLVQVGGQAMADRYTYLPCIGLWIMLAWGARDWISANYLPRQLAAAAAGLAMVACIFLTHWQIHFWKDSITLYTRCAEVTDKRYAIYSDLGHEDIRLGQYPQAIHDLSEAVSDGEEMTPWVDHARAYNDLGYAYLHEGQVTNAITNFIVALLCKSNYPEAYYNYGRALLDNRQPDLAVKAFRHAVALDASVPETHVKLAGALAQTGQPSEAMSELSKALQLAEAQNNPALAKALAIQLRAFQGDKGTRP